MRVCRCETMLSLREHSCLRNVGKLKADAQAVSNADADEDAVVVWMRYLELDESTFRIVEKSRQL